MGAPPTVESGRTVASKDQIMKCFVTDGRDATLTGQVIIFFKVSQHLWGSTFQIRPIFDSMEITIMVVYSRNMASLKKFEIVFTD